MNLPVRAWKRPFCARCAPAAAPPAPPARRAASAGSSHARSGSMSGSAAGLAGAVELAAGAGAGEVDEGPAAVLAAVDVDVNVDGAAAAGASRGLVQVVSPVCAFQKYQALALSRDEGGVSWCERAPGEEEGDGLWAEDGLPGVGGGSDSWCGVLRVVGAGLGRVVGGWLRLVGGGGRGGLVVWGLGGGLVRVRGGV